MMHTNNGVSKNNNPVPKGPRHTVVKREAP